MLDKYNREINYLRISVTDRCNFRCVYCMPPEGVKLMIHDKILTFDQIVEIARTAVKNGITKIRLTGGEPLVRKDIVQLVEMIAKIDGIKDFAMTTNGVFLVKYAKALASAGLNRVNISLDTLDPDRFKEITRTGNLLDVLNGIQAAKEAGLLPIKINCVIQKSENEPDAVSVAKFCSENNLQIRYIREMDLEKGRFWQVKGGEGGACKTCNRLRLTSEGKIRPCLFSNLEFDTKILGIEKAFAQAIENKPEKGTLNNNNKFSNIGG